jgi:hypothetical protein
MDIKHSTRKTGTYRIGSDQLIYQPLLTYILISELLEAVDYLFCRGNTYIPEVPLSMEEGNGDASSHLYRIVLVAALVLYNNLVSPSSHHTSQSKNSLKIPKG